MKQTAKAVNNDRWSKQEPGCQTLGSYRTPKGEPPICCEDARKNPTVNKPIYPSGSFQCPPEEGGCGSVWKKEEG